MELKNPVKLTSSLAKVLQYFCKHHVEFETWAQLTGHLSLKTDCGKSLDFSVNEKLALDDGISNINSETYHIITDNRNSAILEILNRQISDHVRTAQDHFHENCNHIQGDFGNSDNDLKNFEVLNSTYNLNCEQNSTGHTLETEQRQLNDTICTAKRDFDINNHQMHKFDCSDTGNCKDFELSNSAYNSNSHCEQHSIGNILETEYKYSRCANDEAKVGEQLHTSKLYKLLFAKTTDESMKKTQGQINAELKKTKLDHPSVAYTTTKDNEIDTTDMSDKQVSSDNNFTTSPCTNCSEDPALQSMQQRNHIIHTLMKCKFCTLELPSTDIYDHYMAVHHGSHTEDNSTINLGNGNTDIYICDKQVISDNITLISPRTRGTRVSLDTSLKEMLQRNHNCPHCEHVASRYQHLKAHIDRVHKLMKCQFCSLQLPCTEMYDHYMKIHAEHTKDVKHICVHCGKIFTRAETLQRHIETAHKCIQCGEQFAMKANLKQHIETKHKDFKYKCHCGKILTSKVMFERHIAKVHTTTTYLSNDYGQQLTSLPKLKSRTDNVHKKGNKTCNVCEQEFSSTIALRSHIDIVHKKITHLCHLCGAHFLYNRRLLNHIHKVHNKKVKGLLCPQCGLRFTFKSSLKFHIMKVHSNITPEQICPHCQKACYTEDHLKIHIQNVHGSKPYKCTTCDYSSNKEHDVKKHIDRVHNKIRSHKCLRCEYSSSARWELTKHIANMHPNESKNSEEVRKYLAIKNSRTRSHHCHQCDKSFYDRYKLKTHISSVHHKVKPHKCPHCDYAASRYSNLKKHIDIIHKHID